MLELHEFHPGFGMPTMSPFGLKLEAFMTLSGIAYKPVFVTNTRRGPKGKIPYVVDGGKRIADSGHIMEHLITKHGSELDRRLSSGERGMGHAVRRLLEESTYFVNVYERWVLPEGLAITAPIFLQGIPPLVRSMLLPVARGQVKRALHAQGISRHTKEEISDHGISDVKAFLNFLGDRPFLFGSEPTSFDCAAYGILFGMLKIPLPTPTRDFVASQETIVAFCDRMTEKCFKDDPRLRSAG